jgi:hypothetical protein
MLGPINPNVTRSSHLAAVLAIDEALTNLPGISPERISGMRLLGGSPQPQGGPALKFTDESIVYLAGGLACALEVIRDQQERIADLERLRQQKAKVKS